MESVNEPIEHGRGNVVGILVVDLQPRERLLTLALDLFDLERRMPHNVREQIEPGAEAVFHDDDAGKAQVAAGARFQITTDRVDLVGNLLRRLFRRPLVEQRSEQRCQPFLVLGSAADPARTRRRRLTSGCSWCRTTTTLRPFEAT